MVQINLEIPGYIKEHDLQYLGSVVRQLPENSTILDIGAGWGREAWVFSKNAPVSTKIFCTDVWGWPPTWKYVFRGNDTIPETDRTLVNSQDEFHEYVKDCTNITSHKTVNTEEWASPMADFIFYDEEDEVYELIVPKLRHWFSRLKPNGVLAGTDFYPYSSPPVKVGLVQAVRDCAKEFGMVLIHNTNTSIWMMVNPNSFQKQLRIWN